METTKYNNPPLVEVVFEFYFSTKSWTSIVPGMFYNEIKDKFPNISQNQGGFGIAFDGNGVKIGTRNSELTQYKNTNGDTIIQLASNLLTINKLPKYEGWDKYAEIIRNAIEALSRVLQIDKIERIGLKAINKIDIQEHSLVNLKKHFTIYPKIPNNANNQINAVQLNLESPLIENTEILAILLATLRKEPNFKAPVILQIYMTRISDVPEKCNDWLEHAHSKINETFDTSLTSFSKRIFNND